MTHDDLVARAEKWLRGTVGCKVTLTDQMRAATRNGEQPDAIGWRGDMSILVECKVSRSDFLSDLKKRFRRHPEQGMGAHRVYMCPPRVITPSDLPEGWLLLYAYDKKIEKSCCPQGNIHWAYPRFPDRNKEDEIRMLVSALRRIDRRGLLGAVYEDMNTQYEKVGAS